MRRDETSTDRQNLDRLIAIVTEFRDIDARMDLGQLLVFLLVARSPGISTGDLKRITGLASSTISRHLIQMTDQSYQNTPVARVIRGSDLLRQQADPLDLRYKQTFPTISGDRLTNKVLAILKSNPIR